MGGFSKTKMISVLSYAKFQWRINQRWSYLIMLNKRVYTSWTFTQNLFSFPIVLFIVFFHQHFPLFQLLKQLARNYSYFVQSWENSKQINLIISNSCLKVHFECFILSVVFCRLSVTENTFQSYLPENLFKKISTQKYCQSWNVLFLNLLPALLCF